MKKTDSLQKLTQIYIREIIRLHGVPVNIVSDRDPRFVSGFWKLSARKGLINPKKGGKLSPRYIGPYKILQMMGMHDVFHVSRLKKYQPDPEHIITQDTPPLMENLSYIEKPIRIIDQQIRQLRNIEIPMVKVVWRNHNRDKDATWEMEEDMSNQYQELF
ncbi:hypothetical protein DH2020_005509 [Rehmannia glutinosa]|uniref:Uncharacterized protein n=1 Tax=Rehmannia glutinosa TaxID=99300 RepID=A0ABR0XGC0_REHGL